MSWQDIIKYKRENYRKAGAKHNDPETIERHKKILEEVKNSKIKNRKMGKNISRIRSGQLMTPNIGREEGSLELFSEQLNEFEELFSKKYESGGAVMAEMTRDRIAQYINNIRASLEMLDPARLSRGGGAVPENIRKRINALEIKNINRYLVRITEILDRTSAERKHMSELKRILE